MPIFTIGYGNRSIEAFLALLRGQTIEYLIDIRSQPYSRYSPDFSKAALESHLAAQGIRYVFMGDTLGGRPADPSCYTDGKVDYDKVQAKPFYQQGIQRLKDAAVYRIALMCSELRPEDCHRAKLVGETLRQAQIEVVHIDGEGKTQTQDEVMRIVNASLTGVSPQQTSFLGDDFAIPLKSRKRYEPQPEERDDD